MMALYEIWKWILSKQAPPSTEKSLLTNEHCLKCLFFSQQREEKRAKSSGKVNLEPSHKKSTQIAVHTSNENNPTTGKHFSLTLERFYVLR